MDSLNNGFRGLSKLLKEGARKQPRDNNMQGSFRCYNCDEEGHMARNCPKKEKYVPKSSFTGNQKGN